MVRNAFQSTATFTRITKRRNRMPSTNLTAFTQNPEDSSGGASANLYTQHWNQECVEAGSNFAEENSTGENRADNLLLLLRSFCHRAVDGLPECALLEVSESLREFAAYYGNHTNCAPSSGDVTKHWTPLHGELAHISAAVERGWKILDRVDEDGAAMVQRSTLTRAVNFLQNTARKVFEAYKVAIDAPIFRPGPDGSVDLHWNYPAYETLINVPSNPDEPIAYYGDDKRGNSAEGHLSSGENIELILWLTKKI
jgi:hypothetical protein